MIFSQHAKGKLLLTAEYFVTEGATALALPTKKGQSMQVEKGEKAGQLHWRSLEENGHCWLEIWVSLPDLELIKFEGEAEEAERLLILLQIAQEHNPNFLADGQGLEVTTQLEFPRDWGLGSSSTLVSLLADWAQVDAHQLLSESFGGSGYDLAAAKAQGPILYRLFNGQPQAYPAPFAPKFKDQLYFLHLNKKQSSREALVHYKVKPAEEREAPIPRISQITHNLAQYCKDLEDFEELLEEHQALLQPILGQEGPKAQFFEDFWGTVKPLGAWGGDFVLVSSQRSEAETKAYFAKKGFEQFIRYEDMVLS